MTKTDDLANQKGQVPRSFRLLECIKKSNDYGMVSYGVLSDDESDEDNHLTLKKWRASIMMYDTNNEILFFNMLMEVPMEYPYIEPIITLIEGLDNKRAKKVFETSGKMKDSMKSKIQWSDKLSLGDYLMKVHDLLKNS